MARETAVTQGTTECLRASHDGPQVEHHSDYKHAGRPKGVVPSAEPWGLVHTCTERTTPATSQSESSSRLWSTNWYLLRASSQVGIPAEAAPSACGHRVPEERQPHHGSGHADRNKGKSSRGWVRSRKQMDAKPGAWIPTFAVCCAGKDQASLSRTERFPILFGTQGRPVVHQRFCRSFCLSFTLLPSSSLSLRQRCASRVVCQFRPLTSHEIASNE